MGLEDAGAEESAPICQKLEDVFFSKYVMTISSCE